VTSWRIIQGDCRQALATLPDESIQCCITSPPYLGLRNYGVAGQIGLEQSVEEYVAELVAVFREVRRVLRDDGTLWLNMGDAYADRANRRSDGLSFRSDRRDVVPAKRNMLGGAAALKAKDLMGLPWMVAFALRTDGWWLREDVIWHKITSMPESVGDRCTRAHEYLFRLTKRGRYYADQDAIREPDKGADHPRNVLAGQASLEPSSGLASPHSGLRTVNGRDGLGANKRSVWPIASQPFAEAHFATVPPKLIEPMVLASTSPAACGECGAPRRRLVETTVDESRGPVRQRAELPGITRLGQSKNGMGSETFGHRTSTRTLGWEPTCGHDDDSGRCTILDPFAGAGTTGLVALRHGRSFVGIELNPEYVEMARRRIIDDAPLLNQWAEDAA
jgi:DNA modification methylase